ncbi:hypothetical protein F5Y04DRAFT_256353 [Hypomontagnella monticulosa]|nr:hypothetical protein F5Y04DRAFT_256353 [Hypomontagnella monticulosa]
MPIKYNTIYEVSATIHPLPSSTDFSGLTRSDTSSSLIPEPDIDNVTDTSARVDALKVAALIADTINPSVLLKGDESSGMHLTETNQAPIPARTPLPSASSHHTRSASATPRDIDDMGIPTAAQVVQAKYSHIQFDFKEKKLQDLAIMRARNNLRANPSHLGAFDPAFFSHRRSALLQVIGIRQDADAQCNRCRTGKGAWDSCVTTPWVSNMRGACANCAYYGQQNLCSFYKHGIGGKPRLIREWTFDISVSLSVNATIEPQRKLKFDYQDTWKFKVTNSQLYELVYKLDLSRAAVEELLKTALTQPPKS